MHVHHIRDFDPNDPLTHADENLITLCSVCHVMHHRDRSWVGEPPLDLQTSA